MDNIYDLLIIKIQFSFFRGIYKLQNTHFLRFEKLRPIIFFCLLKLKFFFENPNFKFFTQKNIFTLSLFIPFRKKICRFSVFFLYLNFFLIFEFSLYKYNKINIINI